MADVATLAAEGIDADTAILRAADSTVALVDGSWALGSEVPHGDYLRNTSHSIDTSALKSYPVGDRTPDWLRQRFEATGLRSDVSATLVYDRVGLFSAPWVWWTLLRAGQPAHLVEGTSADTVPDFEDSDTPGAVAPAPPIVQEATLSDVVAWNGQIVDARGTGRFHGTEPEPRAGLRSGHIPGSVNVPYGTVKSGDRVRPAHELRDLFAAKSLDLSAPIITTCGSGVTACLVAYALWRAGASDVRVYSGSWAEYGASDHPVATG